MRITEVKKFSATNKFFSNKKNKKKLQVRLLLMDDHLRAIV